MRTYTVRGIVLYIDRQGITVNIKAHLPTRLIARQGIHLLLMNPLNREEQVCFHCTKRYRVQYKHFGLVKQGLRRLKI
ncbi:MAG: hypothetical protein LBP64_04925 [Tannerella sp.]|jgi:hypothetical protein|nr:hypothetical protein [Tannerella sp.]